MKNLAECMLLSSLGELSDRNYTLSGGVSNYPKSMEFSYLLPVKDQGNTMKCVGYSHSTHCEMSFGLNEYLSHDFIYFNRNLSNGDIPFQGYYNILAEKHLVSEGVCLLKDFSCNQEAPDGIFTLDKVRATLLDKASKYKIKAYYELKSIDELKSFMNTYKCPIIISIAVYESVASIKSDGIFPMSSGKILGYHSICVVGYDEKYIKIINSIGAEWGDKGYGYIPIADDRVIQDMRGIIVENNKAIQIDIPKPVETKVLYRVQISANRDKNNALEDQAILAKKELNDVQRKALNTPQNYLGSCLIYENGYYKCQVGSFAIQENAVILLNILKELGYKDAWITEYVK